MTGSAVGSSAVLLAPNPFSFSIPGHSWQARSEGAAWSDGNQPVLLYLCAFPPLVLAKEKLGLALCPHCGGFNLQQLQLNQGHPDLGLVASLNVV